jgi:hypothetical protein
LATRGRTAGLGDVTLAGILGCPCGAVNPIVATTALLAALVTGCVFGVTHQRRHNTGQFPSYRA